MPPDLEKRARVRQMWEEGMSFNAMGRELGVNHAACADMARAMGLATDARARGLPRNQYLADDPARQELHAKVKELYLEQYSYSTIAEICFRTGLSHNITKGAVAGIINRMGLGAGGRKPGPHPGTPKPRSIRPVPDSSLSGAPPLPLSMTRMSLPLDTRILTIHELSVNTCRWPVCEDATCDVAGKIYCGAPISPKSSYCPGHTRLSLA